MQPFKIGPKFYIIFTVLALFPAMWIARMLQNLIEVSSTGVVKVFADLGLVEAPSAIFLIGTMYWVYERFLWRIWPVRYIHNLPDIAGRYVGEIESSYDDTKYPFVLEIRQTLQSVSICLYTERSSSFSVIANVGDNEYGNRILVYVYKNTPRTVSKDLDMRSHDGFACLEIFQDEHKLAGFYFNDPRERGRHGKLSCSWTESKLKGRF